MGNLFWSTPYLQTMRLRISTEKSIWGKQDLKVDVHNNGIISVQNDSEAT